MKKLLLLKSLLFLCALIVGSSAWADADILYSENFGNPASNTYISSYTGWSATSSMFNLAGAETVASCYSGNKVGTADASSSSDYSAASGQGNAFQQGTANTTTTILTVQKIKITDKSSLCLNFAIRNGGAAAYVDAYYQIDDGIETKLTLSGYESTVGWHYVSASIPGTGTNLKLIFKQTPTKGWTTRIDDVKVTGVSSGGGGSSTVSTPTFNHGTATYTTAQSISLSCSTEGATIRYTMAEDGTTPEDPTESDDAYTTALSVTKSGTIIKAKAFKVGSTASSVATATYTIQPAKPTFDVSTVVTGKVNPGTQLTISATAGNTIIYTIDGTKPSFAEPNGDIYDSPITINTPMTIKAIAVDDYENESQQTIATYAIYYAGGVNITPNYTFFGKDDAFSGTTNDEVTGITTEGIVLTYTRNGSSLYASGSAMRFYKDNTLRIDAPTGKTITNVVFTQSNGTVDDMTSTPSGYNSTTKTWTGDATSVTFTRTADSYLQFSNIEVVLAEKVTIGTYQWATYVSDQVLDFTDSDVKAYVVTGASGTVISKTAVTKAAANTPLLLNAPAETYTIPAAASGTDYSLSNKLVAGDGSTITSSTGAGFNYVLGVEGGNAMFLLINGTSAVVPAGKAYLALDAAPARGLNLFDNEETTGVNTVQNSKVIVNGYYDLLGRKVANPTKGLYIVNGKKVVIK